MKLVSTAIVGLLVLFALQDNIFSQVSWSNGTLGIQLSNAGRLRVSLTPYSSSSRQITQMTPVAAWTKDYVFDYVDDADSMKAAHWLKVQGADSAGEALIDNRATFLPPKVHVRITVMTWNNQGYLIVRYSFFNDTLMAMNLHLGAELLPRPGGSFGGETVTYDTTSKTAYFYRASESNYWGSRLLGQNPYSVKILDWDAYSSDPNSEVAPDSMKYQMTAGTGFDPTLQTAGVDGSIYYHNAGAVNLVPGDSATLYYAVSYGTTAAEMLASADSAVAKYNMLITSVSTVPGVLPDMYSLQQNYPNPFNPSTLIPFQLTHEGFTTLKVYDMLGREVGVLVNEHLAPGTYTVRFGGDNLPSGVYTYRLTTGSFTETRRMILIR